MPHLLYIDPGTGSMLFSIFIGIAATLFFFAKAAILKLVVFVSGKRSGIQQDASYKPYVVYVEGKQYWNVFKPIVDEFEKRQLPLTYYTSAEDDSIFDTTYTYVHAEYIGKGNAAFAKLNMLSAGIVVMTTPGLNVYQLKRSKNVRFYANILHGASDPTMMKWYGLDFFDAILLTGDYQRTDLRMLEQKRKIPAKQLPTIGCTYLDALQQKMDSIPVETPHQFTVLVSPSWGPSSLLSKYGTALLDPLVATGWNIIIRPHPQSKRAEPEVIETLTQTYQNAKNVTWDYSRDNIIVMKKADIMISDFSAIIYDYTFLCDKPVMYVNADLDLRPYDAYELDNHGKDIWQFRVLKEMGIELKQEQFANIKTIIEQASDNEHLHALRQKAKSEAWMHIGHAAENAVNFMIDTVKSFEQAKDTHNEQKHA
ncbi:MAG: CDP-glycerol glycerophosphotransferase family protein [Treponema sp.]|nr:CDP-glycerol glycerophosphotransferase family protein [Treponema sp.]